MVTRHQQQTAATAVHHRTNDHFARSRVFCDIAGQFRYGRGNDGRIGAGKAQAQGEFARALARHPALRMTEGKKVWELQPDVDWDKGRAVLWLIETLKLEDALPVYIGDDVTDEDAFRALEHRGVGIAVQDAAQPTAATLTLRDPDEVRDFLAGL